MKTLTRALGLFVLSILVFNNSMAQKASYTTNGGLTIGFGAGYSYQKSDLLNSRGFGFDFILGSQLYKKENAFLSVDWKFRFLPGQNKAYDHRINPDNTYSNIRYSFFTYDLELGLTLNRLRERTRIVLTGFVGAGITHGRTFTDLYDAGGNLYDYSSIDPNRNSELVYTDLVLLSDGDFETRLVNKAALLPTAGLYLGYQLSRSLTIGVEFKTNFYLTEHNSFWGIDIDNRVLPESRKDRNNYVSLGFRWSLGRGSSHSSYTGTYSSGVTSNSSQTTNTNTHVAVLSSSHPSVDIIDPPTDTYNTVSHTHTIRATIHNVSGPENISFYQNGFPNNSFTYNVNTHTLVANVSLREGVNTIKITASNQASTADDLVNITFDIPPEPVITLPYAEFTSPWRSQVTSSSERLDITASLKNIHSNQDIELTQNGQGIPFEYEVTNGLVRTSVLLTEGQNNILITGSNESGSARDQLMVDYIIPGRIALPTVRFVNPAFPLVVNNSRFPLSAETQHVGDRNDLTIIVNGSAINHFSFGITGEIDAGLILSNGINTVEIIARNDAGTASDRTSITYHAPAFQETIYNEPVYNEPVIIVTTPVIIEEPRPCPPPKIRLIDPDQGQISTSQQSYGLRAELRNITSKNQLRLSVNGNAVPFSYNNHLVSSSVPLIDGLNTLSLSARNECGEDQASTRINYKPSAVTEPCQPPTVTFNVNEGNSADATHELRGSISGVKNKSEISLTVNGRAKKGFQFIPATGDLSAKFKLTPGSHTIIVSVNNACGADSKGVNVKMETPCTPPKITFTVNAVNREDATHELRGSISGVKNKSEISLTVNGGAHEGFQFVPATGDLSAKLKLSPGSHTIIVSVNNACGSDSKGFNLKTETPCTPPTVSFTLTEVNREDATHELRGSISGVKNKSEISLTLDGRANNGFQFVPSTGDLSAKLKLSPGSHSIVVTVNNACGTDSKSEAVSVEEEEEDEEEACGIRINPGNSDWQFCLVTPSGTFSRKSLTNSNFSYSGSASSLYIKPIGGGGNATVNGRPYAIRSGQYYLFSGNLNVSVSTKNPGAMGQWSVCIVANRAPVSGNGNNRPASPCEAEKNENLKGAAVNNATKDATNTRTNYRTNDKTGTRTNTRTSTRTNNKSREQSTGRTNNRSAEKRTGGTTSRTKR